MSLRPRASGHDLGRIIEEDAMAHRSIADDFVTLLVQAGVERIYGIVGDSLNPVTDAVRRSGRFLRMHVRYDRGWVLSAGC
jgi:pyruvate dehydrogenase (quinone)